MAEENKLIEAVQEDLLKKSEMVSSAPTKIEETISGAITGVEKGAAASAERIESQFGREKTFQAGQFAQQRTSVEEAQRGFATNTAALQQLDERTEKSLRDLEDRKQEMLLAGEAAAAGQISQLQLQSLTFQMQAEQQAFTNMISAGTFALQAKNLETSAAQFTAEQDFKKAQFQFTQDAAISDVATRFGLVVEEGETLASMTQKAQPKADAEQKARLAKALKESGTTETELNIDSQITDLIVNQGSDPVTAALQAMADLKAIGIETTKEDLNRAMKRSQEIFDSFKIEQDRADSEVDKGGILQGISDFFQRREQAGGVPGQASPLLPGAERPKFQSLDFGGPTSGNAAIGDLTSFAEGLFQL